MKRLALALLFLSLLGEAAPLSFEDALHQIVSRSVPIAQQRATVESTKAKNLASHLSLLPTLSGTLSENYNHSVDFYGAYDKRGATLNANLNLFKFGADVSAMRAANAEDNASELMLSDATLKAEDEGVRALVTFIQEELTVTTWKQIVQMRMDAYKVAQARYNRGLIALQEADKFLVDLDNSQSQLQDAEVEAAKSRADLRTLLGDEEIDIRWPWKADLSKASQLIAGATSPDLANRPDWQASKLSVQAAHDRMRQGWGQMLPSLDASGSWGYAYLQQPYPTNGPEWSGMITLTVPLFDRLANYGNYRALVASLSSAEAQFDQIKRQAKSEVASAKEALQISLEGAQARDRTLEVSRRLYESNLERYRRAIVNANDLMNDQDRLYQSELSAIKGWADTHMNFGKLCHALGKRVDTCLGR